LGSRSTESARVSPMDGRFGQHPPGAGDRGSQKPGEPHDRLQGATNLHRMRGASRRSREERQGRNGTRRLASSSRRRVEQSTAGSGRAFRMSMEGIFQKQREESGIDCPQVPGQEPASHSTQSQVHCEVGPGHASGTPTFQDKVTRGRSSGSTAPGTRALRSSPRRPAARRRNGEGHGGPRERPTTRNRGANDP
jgi:hypothetical protein